MSRVITPPDTDFASANTSLLAVNLSDSDVEILTLFLKQYFKDVDVYLYRDEFEDSGWAMTVAAAVDKVFNKSSCTVQDIMEYLQGLNG